MNLAVIGDVDTKGTGTISAAWNPAMDAILDPTNRDPFYSCSKSIPPIMIPETARAPGSSMLKNVPVTPPRPL